MTPVEKSPPGEPLTMEQVSAMADQLIVDAERYKRERDEAVGHLKNMVGVIDFAVKGKAISVGDKVLGEPRAFLTRIEQADRSDKETLLPYFADVDWELAVEQADIQNRLGTAVLTPEDAAKCIPADGRVVSVEQADKGVGL